MTTGSSVTFHRLYGDQSGNATVNNLDFINFRITFGKTSADANFDASFDFDGNGVVNNADYVQFRNRFGKVYTY